MVSTILGILSAIINIYTILCVISIILTWFPGAKFTAFGKFLSSICDPYLNLFSKSGKLRIGNIDFSPILAIGILSLLTTILSRITLTGRIFFGGILAAIVSLFWNLGSSLLGILTLIILVRWIVLLVKKGYTPYDSGWNNVDAMLQKPVYKISSTFSKNPVSYQTALLISWITLAVILLLGAILSGILIHLCNMLPF
jgi:YggT family protein